MSTSQARKQAAQGSRQLNRCAACKRKLPRSGGRLVPGTGICCERCAPARQESP